MCAEMRTYLKGKSATTPSLTPVRAGLLQRKCACGGTPRPTGECEECRKKQVQLKSRNSDTSTQPSTLNSQPSDMPPIVHEALRSPGQPLDPATRAATEPLLRHDFSQVRVHTGAQAAESARAVNAYAYTVGNNVVFAEGQYVPATDRGMKLLTHELTHVIQQKRSVAPAGFPMAIDPEPRLEAEAEEVASRDRVPQLSAYTSLQRQTPPG
jgi:hypothetical protein